jgi:hypothetical protein
LNPGPEITLQQHVADLREGAGRAFDLHAQQRSLPDIDQKVGHVPRFDILAETPLALTPRETFAQLLAIAMNGVTLYLNARIRLHKF